jgi:hypothetical protein
MREQDRILKHIALSKFKDTRVVQAIAYHPLLFAKRKMSDPDDYRPVRIRYFGVFVQKYMHNKEMFKKMSYIFNTLKEHPKLIKVFIDPKFSTLDEALDYVKQLIEENNKDALNVVYDVLVKAIEDK